MRITIPSEYVDQIEPNELGLMRITFNRDMITNDTNERTFPESLPGIYVDDSTINIIIGSKSITLEA